MLFGCPRVCSASAALRVCPIGYFQPDKGQFGCISCDIILGDFYQELSAQSSCVACPPSTQRFIGLLTAATKSSCQCKEGDVSVELALLGSMDCGLLPCRLLQQRGPVRRGATIRHFGSHNELFASVHLAPLRLRFSRLACIRLMLGARSWTFYLQACEKCTTRRSPYTLRSPHRRLNVRLGVGCAGPMGSICDGQLASPRERAAIISSFAPPAAANKLCAAMSRAFERIAGQEWCYSQAPIYT